MSPEPNRSTPTKEPGQERGPCYRIIMAAIPDSPIARAIVDTASKIAECFDGRVHLFHTVDPGLEFPPAAPTPSDGLESYLAGIARANLKAFAAGNPRVTIEEPLLSTNEAWHSILGEAQRLGADLIVMGSHTYQGWDRVLRSTTDRIIDRGVCDVLVIRER